MDASDWEPLPPEQLGLHPGEDVELRKTDQPPGGEKGHPGVVPRPAPWHGKVPDPVEPVEPAAPELDPAQARALLVLQKKMLAAPKSRSFITELENREHKEERRRRASHDAVLVSLAPTTCDLTAADIPLAVAYTADGEGRDAREDEGWFAQLPAAERERLRSQWSGKRAQVECSASVQRRNRTRRALTALVVFGVTAVLGMPGSWPVTVCAGIICSIVWSYIGPCRYRDPIVAMACFYAVNLTAWLMNGANGLPSGSFMDAILLVSLACVTGFDAEIRRNGGFDNCR